MFDEPNEEPVERSSMPADRAKEKADEFRMHAELAAVFEGVRKFDAVLLPGLSADTARDIQRSIGKLEKSRSGDSAVLPPTTSDEATRLLLLPKTLELSTNDYHIHRRPGEVMIIRWLSDDLVDPFYERLQAHFDAALEGHKEDEQQAHEWKQDTQAGAYSAALDKIEVNMPERYRREEIRKHNFFALSTQTADEMNIAYLCDHIMGVPTEDLVGAASAPPSDPSEQDLAWFFKLYSLRGIVEGVERMCFFTYMQKSEDSW